MAAIGAGRQSLLCKCISVCCSEMYFPFIYPAPLSLRQLSVGLNDGTLLFIAFTVLLGISHIIATRFPFVNTENNKNCTLYKVEQAYLVGLRQPAEQMQTVHQFDDGTAHLGSLLEIVLT